MFHRVMDSFERGRRGTDTDTGWCDSRVCGTGVGRTSDETVIRRDGTWCLLRCKERLQGRVSGRVRKSGSTGTYPKVSEGTRPGSGGTDSVP